MTAKKKPKPQREGPLKINLPFKEAVTRAFKVKPPPGGWAAYDKRQRDKKVASAARRAKHR